MGHAISTVAGSRSSAGEIRPASPSSHIRDLVDDIAFALFERSNAGVRPTEAGKHFLWDNDCSAVAGFGKAKLAGDRRDLRRCDDNDGI
jgi:hypothetical protein